MKYLVEMTKKQFDANGDFVVMIKHQISITLGDTTINGGVY